MHAIQHLNRLRHWITLHYTGAPDKNGAANVAGPTLTNVQYKYMYFWPTLKTGLSLRTPWSTFPTI